MNPIGLKALKQIKSQMFTLCFCCYFRARGSSGCHAPTRRQGVCVCVCVWKEEGKGHSMNPSECGGLHAPRYVTMLRIKGGISSEEKPGCLFM